MEPEGAGPHDIDYWVASDADFKNLLKAGKVTVQESEDCTLRLKLVELSAYTTYYYRFRYRGVTSETGRTKTAPAPDQDVPVRFAFASCQDFVGRH